MSRGPFDTDNFQQPRGEHGTPLVYRMRVKEVVQPNGVNNTSGGVYGCVHWDGVTEGKVKHLVAAPFPFNRRVATPGGVDQTDTELFAFAPHGGAGTITQDGARRVVPFRALPFVPCCKAKGQFLYLETIDTFGTICWSPGPRFANVPTWAIGPEE